MITEAMEQIAKSDPQRLLEITSGLGDVLGFLIDSPPEDNILDTGFIFILVSVLTELRATGQLPVIRRAYEKDRVELFQVGSLEDVEQDMMESMRPPQDWLPILEQYAEYEWESDGSNGDHDDAVLTHSTQKNGPDSLLGNPALAYPVTFSDHLTSSPAPTTGRNDPCPCGSGRKYKKCCMD